MKWILRLRKSRKQQLTRSPESVSTPLGHVPYRYCRVKTQAWRPMVSARYMRNGRGVNDER